LRTTTKRELKIFGPSLAKSKIRAAKEKCAGDTAYRRAYFNAGCVDFGESDDVENIFNSLHTVARKKEAAETF